MILAQSVNATFSMQMLKSFKETILSEGQNSLNKELSQILDIITGKPP